MMALRGLPKYPTRLADSHDNYIFDPSKAMTPNKLVARFLIYHKRFARGWISDDMYISHVDCYSSGNCSSYSNY